MPACIRLATLSGAWFAAALAQGGCSSSSAHGLPSDGTVGGAGGDGMVGGQPTSDAQPTPDAPAGGAAGSGGAAAGGSGGSPGTGGAGGTGAGPTAATVTFPRSAPWYQDVTSAALDAQSGPVMAGLSAHGGFGAGAIRIDFSIQVLRADPALAARPFTRTGDFYDPDCDFVPVPVPPGGRLEGESNYSCAGNGDCHLLVLQGSKLYEMWRANIGGAGGAADNPFAGGCLAVWDTTRDYWKAAPAGFSRGDQCSSADAAGYPISALLFNADEIKAGAIEHAIRFILPNARIRKGEYVHPATHSGAGKGTPTADLVPYGARLRLKSTFNLQSLPSEGARVVARALMRYGMFLADGGNIALTAQSDSYSKAKWSGLLSAGDLTLLKVTDFEMVDGGARIPLTLDCKRTP
jgi:hypothetical protein